MTHEEAMAKAKEFTSKDPCPHRDEAERNKFEIQLAMRFQFEATFNEWLQNRINEANEETDAEQAARCDRTDDLAELILTLPAPYDWMIFRKFEVIDYCITKHGEATWGEMMALTALGGIKADLLRFGIMREERLERELITQAA